MIVPTLLVAIVISYKSWKEKDDEFWINLAICFWISANSYWMICEFIDHEEVKNYAGIAFIAGMLCVAYFYYKRLVVNKRNNEIF
jgi:hypothetical protein